MNELICIQSCLDKVNYKWDSLMSDTARRNCLISLFYKFFKRVCNSLNNVHKIIICWERNFHDRQLSSVGNFHQIYLILKQICSKYTFVNRCLFRSSIFWSFWFRLRGRMKIYVSFWKNGFHTVINSFKENCRKCRLQCIATVWIMHWLVISVVVHIQVFRGCQRRKLWILT